MAHDHDHGSKTEYYLEQLFTIGICGAIGAVAVGLRVSGKLNYMLHPSFHPWVLAGGIGLLVLVVIRAVTVWNSVAEPMSVPVHDHDHEPDHHHTHDHDHDHAHHDHAHHDHDHGDHSHSHDHGHDHGWAPWRYVVLMLPVVLYLLNLPNEGLSASGRNKLDISGVTVQRTVAESSLGALRNVGFLQLEEAAKNPGSREYFEGRKISIVGLFSGEDPKRFRLMRYKLNCCAADAVAINAAILIDPNPQVDGIDIKAMKNKWVEVTGLLTFVNQPGANTFLPVILIQPKDGEKTGDYVKEVPADPNPYANF